MSLGSDLTFSEVAVEGKKMTGHKDGDKVYFWGKRNVSTPANCEWTLTTDDGDLTKKVAVISVEKNKAYNLSDFVNTIPVGALSGKFSVSATKQVYFSKGNLQATYNGTGYDWGFAPNQYDFIGGDQGAAGTGINTGNNRIDRQLVGDIVDLFGWTPSGKYDDGIKQYGINTSTTNDDYYINDSDVCCDWGATIEGDVSWRLLSYDEWNYLINERRVKRNGKVDEESGEGNTYQWEKYNNVYGIIIYPDESVVEKYAQYAEISISDFPKGCVFLTTAGWRSGLDYAIAVTQEGNSTMYWTSTKFDKFEAYTIHGYYYEETENRLDKFYRHRGHAVRLVTDCEE